MCLISKWRFPKRAKEDIICYKMLGKGSSKDRERGIYEIPFQYTSIRLNTIIKAKGSSLCFSSLCHEKTAGYVHAYIYPTRPANFEFPDCDYSMFKAIIPKGTKYHISKNNREICARKMYITNEKIKL